MTTHEFTHGKLGVILTDGKGKTYTSAHKRLKRHGYRFSKTTKFDGVKAHEYVMADGRYGDKKMMVIHPSMKPKPPTMVIADTPEALEIARDHIKSNGYMEMRNEDDPEFISNYFANTDFGIRYLKLIDATKENAHDEAIQDLVDKSFDSSEGLETGE
ncbi:hypothetical protein CL614_00940 [archaeon]|nr:hypothetical protein [archaeon]|tara:strand:- start:194 stop:667 length:474 start_codon:yes stop_codon:yes gene_type:complete